MRIKNKDIAAKLGISATAVSLALNGHPGVSEDTRRRVLELASGGETPAPAAPAPAAGGTVAFVVHKGPGHVISDNPFFQGIVESVQQRAQKHGLTVVLAHYAAPQSLDDHLSYLAGLGLSGLLIQATELTAPELERYLGLGLPTVLVDGYFDLIAVDAVTLDDQAAIFRAFDYAHSMGHRRIGFLAGSPTIENFQHHLDGYWRGVSRYLDCDDDASLVIELPCSIEGAEQAMAAWLAEHGTTGLPTCFLTDLDNIAVGAMRALQAAGLSVPQDVSLIGYGNTDIAAVCTPALTSTQINLLDSGGLAVDALAHRIRFPHGHGHTTTLVSSYLVKRDSVARIDR